MARFRTHLAQFLEVSGLVSLVVGAFQVTSAAGFAVAGIVSLWFARGLAT